MNMFDKLVKINCYSKHTMLRQAAVNLLEKFYCCEINCTEIWCQRFDGRTAQCCFEEIPVRDFMCHDIAEDLLFLIGDPTVE